MPPKYNQKRLNENAFNWLYQPSTYRSKSNTTTDRIGMAMLSSNINIRGLDLHGNPAGRVDRYMGSNVGRIPQGHRRSSSQGNFGNYLDKLAGSYVYSGRNSYDAFKDLVSDLGNTMTRTPGQNTNSGGSGASATGNTSGQEYYSSYYGGSGSSAKRKYTSQNPDYATIYQKKDKKN
jgi:hypothetical protein